MRAAPPDFLCLITPIWQAELPLCPQLESILCAQKPRFNKLAEKRTEHCTGLTDTRQSLGRQVPSTVMPVQYKKENLQMPPYAQTGESVRASGATVHSGRPGGGETDCRWRLRPSYNNAGDMDCPVRSTAPPAPFISFGHGRITVTENFNPVCCQRIRHTEEPRFLTGTR